MTTKSPGVSICLGIVFLCFHGSKASYFRQIFSSLHEMLGLIFRENEEKTILKFCLVKFGILRDYVNVHSNITYFAVLVVQ